MAHNNTDRSLKDLSSPNYNNPMWSRRTSSTFSSRVRIDPGAGSVNLSSVRLGRGQAPEIDQRPLSSMEFRSDRRDTRMMRSTTVMTIHSDSEPEYEVASPMAFPVERRESRLVRNATVMTIHSGSEPEYEVASPMTFPTGQRGGRMMRNTTVMTMHSDSDPEYESSHDSPTQQDQASLDGMTIIFDNGLSSIPSEDSGRNRTNIRNRHGATNIKPGSTKRSRFYRFGGPESEISDDDQATSSDDRSVDPSETFIQANDIDSEDDEDCEGRACHSGIDDDDDDDDEGDDDESELEDEPSRRKNFLGSYLLAPMGFDDDEVEGNAHAFEGFYEAAERFQVFAGVNEFDESDQIGLGEHPYQVIPKNKRRDQERILENKRRQGKLLLVSLLDNFCLLYDQSPERNRKLFYVICKTLSNMGIIDEEYLEEMSTVRSSYQRAFRSLVLSALTSIKQEQMILESRRIMAPPSRPTGNQTRKESLSHGLDSEDSGQSYSDSFSSKGIIPSAYLHTPPINDSVFASSAMMRTMSFGDMFDNDPTRYKHDFVEICKLGKGGFASVFKARNKLDGIEYAIKKIRLRGSAKMRYEKIFREIKFLARLDHKNVIRYYSSWLEHADYPLPQRKMYDGGELDTNGEFDDEYDDEYGDEDEYTNTMSMQEEVNMPERFRRRSSTDYFGPHKEQHSSNPEDLSMGIVFDHDDEEEEDDGISFEDTGISFEDSQGLNDPTEEDAGRHDSVPELFALMNGEDMERVHSASSTLTSRNIPGATGNGSHRRKHKSPSVSLEMCDSTPTWEESDNSCAKTRNSLSNSYSTLSSSIEEIQRSLPSSYSGLGSRYERSRRNDRALVTPEGEYALRPFSFPNLNEVNKKDFVGGGLGGLHGKGRSRSGLGQSRLRNSTRQLIARDLTLFIQMQLCQTTLQDYLVYRNERSVPLPRTSVAELSRKLSKANRFGLLSSSSNFAEPKTHSMPGSPLQQTYHEDLVDPAANQHIFRAIVEGVAYIHDQDMIHRDLKPSNIFLGMPATLEHQRAQQLRQDQCGQDSLSLGSNGSNHMGTLAMLSGNESQHDFPAALLSNDPSQPPLTKEQNQEELFMNIESMIPKIGDFGLVTDMEGGTTTLEGNGGTTSSVPDLVSSVPPLLRRHSSSVTSGSGSSRTRTTAVGTVTYASPEQLARPNLGYDQKADIYSLGIIFFELYHPFSTLMERHAVLRTLRTGELPPEFVSRWPKEAAFVLWLMAEDPQLRPTAREILEFDLIRKPKEEPISAATTPMGNEILSGNGANSSGQSLQSESREKTWETSGGVGIGVSDLSASQLVSGMSASTKRVVCEDCQSRCQCSKSSGSASVDAVGSPKDVTSTRNKGHRSSKSMSSKGSRSDLEQRLKEESDKVKRLEKSMAAMRAENKALLDRIQELEYEKEMSGSSNSGRT